MSDDERRKSKQSIYKIKKQNKGKFAKNIRRKSQKDEENSTLIFEEFSDKDNKFYVDEIEERKKNKKKQKKQKKFSAPKKPATPLQRKVRKIISYCSIVAVVLIIGIVLSLTVLFKTQAFSVVGNTKYDEDEIIETAGISKNENIFLARKSSAEKKIINKYPYVEAVKVSFKIPDTITIKITEAVGTYLIKVSDEKYLLVSLKGRILDQTDNIKGDYADLPIFIGPKIKSEEIGSYIEYEDNTVVEIIDSITNVFADNGYQGITEIDATDTADISFTYKNRIKVRLGLPEDIDYKIRTAMAIITEKIDVTENSSIEGELDVSRCNVTKKSYFDEKTILSVDPTAATENTESTDLSGRDNDKSDSSGGGDQAEASNTDDAKENDASSAEDSQENQPKTPISQNDWYIN